MARNDRFQARLPLTLKPLDSLRFALVDRTLDVAARGTPNEILVKLNKAVNDALAKPDVKAKLEELKG